MTPDTAQEILRKLPSMTDLLAHPRVLEHLSGQPAALVRACLRQALEELRGRLRQGQAPEVGAPALAIEAVVRRAEQFLITAVRPRVSRAINATGVLLHTGLGRAVFSSEIVDSMLPELKGCCTLAVDRESGERAERDELMEPLLTELTGAEAATVVNNNAAATLLVLAGLAAGREVVVSRGQLVEIGGSFRLPEIMGQSQVRLVEVGATNRTHLKDYQKAITPDTAAIMRVHPSNYRIVGFSCETPLQELAGLARERGLILIDDLGAGALVNLEPFGLPHEPTVQESIRAGADVSLFSGDKLIGASQAGIIVGRKALVDRLRKHPLLRAMRVDKTCLMVLERTLQLFRDPTRLATRHPTYRMLTTPLEKLEDRARRLSALVSEVAPALGTSVAPSTAYLGSGAVPTQGIPSVVLQVAHPQASAETLARRLRMDLIPVFGRIENELLLLDMRTVTDEELPLIANALGRAVTA